MEKTSVDLNGVTYRSTSGPVSGTGMDGGDPEAFETGLKAGNIPNIARIMKKGFNAVARGSMPSFTCPNTMSIVTVTEPEVHGISGNFYRDRATG